MQQSEASRLRPGIPRSSKRAKTQHVGEEHQQRRIQDQHVKTPENWPQPWIQQPKNPQQNSRKTSRCAKLQMIAAKKGSRYAWHQNNPDGSAWAQINFECVKQQKPARVSRSQQTGKEGRLNLSEMTLIKCVIAAVTDHSSKWHYTIRAQKPRHHLRYKTRAATECLGLTAGSKEQIIKNSSIKRIQIKEITHISLQSR